MLALLDVESDTNFITENAYSKLKLNNVTDVKISIIGRTSSSVNKQVRLKIMPACTNFNADLNSLIINDITKLIAPVKLDIEAVGVPKNVK